MQIFKTTTVKAAELGTNNPEELPFGSQTPVDQDPAIADAVNDFFGEEGGSAAAPAIPDNPFDLLFAGAPTAPGTIPTDGSPSINDFAPSKVVTVEDWLMANPEGRYYLDSFITKMETVRDTRFVREKASLEEALAKGEMSPRETLVVREKIAELDAVIAKIDQEIEKAKERLAAQKEIYTKELNAMEDLNGDGYIGNPRDKANSFIKAAHPETGQTILLDPMTMKPAVDPFRDPEYAPALLSTDGVVFAGDGLPDAEGTYNLKLNGTRHAQGLGYADNTFGAQIDMTAVEGFWVEADEEGKPKLDNGRYHPKPFQVITREGGGQMIGQKPPTEEERKKFVFVKTTELIIDSESTGKKDKNGVEIDGSNVVFKFEDAEKNVVARLKVEGITTTNPSPLASGQLANGQYYIAASTVGVAVNGGLDDAGEPILHTARISPMVIDASNFRSTGRVLPELPNSRANFFEELGIDPVLNGEGAIRGSKLSNNKKDARRAQNAAYFSTHGGFLDPDPRFLDVHNPGSEIRESLGVDRKEDHVGEEIAEKFGLKNGRVSVSAVYLDKNNKLYDEYRTGIFIKGIRGNITGTDANDIIVVPAPNEEKLRDLLAYGAAEITPDMPVYATVVDGRGGRNIVVSKGGDLYAREVTFLWRESETEGDRVYVHTSNKESHSHATFIHIGDEHPESVHLDNGDDVPAGSDKSEGIKDDWYEIPSKSNLTNTTQPDLPSGNWRQGDPEHIRNEMTAAQEEITNAVTELLKIDPMNSEIEIGEEWGKKFEELEASQNAFFDEWDFFNPMAGEDTGDVTDE